VTADLRWPLRRFVASDGLELAYALDDCTDPWEPAETVIMVHAAMGSSRRFYAWVPHLARRFRVARLDQRGHGGSATPGPDQLSPDRLALDVVELADHLGCRQFHVMGSSAGAVISQQVAVSYPDRVLTLGIFAAAPGIRHAKQNHASWVSRIGEKGVAAFLRETIRDRLDVDRVPAGFVDWFIEESARTPVAVLARFVPMMQQLDLTDALARVRCPTLAVAPGGDPIHAVEHYRAVPDGIADCEFIVYDGLPHNITDMVPDRCAADYRDFLLRRTTRG
jgi:pimeloyl-ACP methyl ester carboxylesterase